MKRLSLLILATVMSVSLVACGGETQVTDEAASLVDITTEHGLSMKLPDDMILQEETLAYMNRDTGDNVAFAVTDTAELLLSDWTEEAALETYQGTYPDATVESFENGLDINGKEASVASIDLTTPGGSAITIVLVIVTDGTTNYVVNFTYGRDKSDSALASNLQTCIDSITIAQK